MILANPHLRSIVDKDGAVILDIERDSISTLNPTGAYVWVRLQKGIPVTEIVESLASETGADVSVVDQDVRAFLQNLKLNHRLSE